MAVQQVREAVVVGRLIDLSIIVPVYNERDNISCFSEQLSRYAQQVTEVIVVDGGSTDGTVEALEELLGNNSNIMIDSASQGRASQMNAGASLARARYLMFLHADTTLPTGVFDELETVFGHDGIWGRFDVKLNNTRTAYRVISWFINKRSSLTGIATGDQAMFVKRSVFVQVGGFPNQLLMEDIALSKTLKSLAQPWCSKLKVITSARKWETCGVIRTVILMWRIRAAYYFGASPKSLHKRYYSQ